MTTLARLAQAARDRERDAAEARTALAAVVARREAAVAELEAADEEFAEVLLAVHATGVLKSKDLEEIVGTKRRATMYRIISQAAKDARTAEAAKAAD